MGVRGVQAYIWAVALAVAGVGMAVSDAAADTLEWALVQAYQNNPSLNAQRAALRATDENVPQALSGYRPKLSVTAQGGYNYTNALQEFPIGGTVTNVPFAETFLSRSVAANGTYTLFNGFQTANRTRQAESQVDGARETLRVTEQQVLLDAATAYMNLLRDQAILDLNRRNVEVLTEQLKQTRDRFNVGEVTRTDVAQAESRLAAGRSSLLGAQSNYVTSQANYRRVIGVDPGRLAPGTPVDRLSPSVLAKAIGQGQANSPSVLAAMYGVDVAVLAVKISEGALYPNLTLTASASQGTNPAFEVARQTAASVLGTFTVPIYQGGAEYSAIRQSKETLDNSGSISISTATRRGPRWCRAGASSTPPRRRSRRPPRRSTPRRSRSTACARRRASASARRSTCSMRSRNWSMPASRSSPPSTIVWWPHIPCLRPSAAFRCRGSASTF